jgi:hypothetical protein
VIYAPGSGRLCPVRTDFEAASRSVGVTEFDPERFERKYEEYLTELQQAYRNAFETMNGEYDSELVHAIDQRILSESEPFHEDGDFRLRLPDDALDRLPVDQGDLEPVLDRYAREIEAELRGVFGLD